MRATCLGEVTIEPAGFTELILALGDLADGEERDKLASALEYFQLGGSRFVPLTAEGEVDRSENRCRITSAESENNPQPVGEAPTRTGVSDPSSPTGGSMRNRLWLYEGKVYRLDRNDYSLKQVHLLILDSQERERKRFEDLEKKFGADRPGTA